MAEAGFELYGRYADDDPVCPRRDGAGWVTGAELRRHVSGLGERLLAARPPGRVLLACRDRYTTLVACLASWEHGLTVVLPPSLASSSVNEVLERSGAALLLTDVTALAALERSVPALEVDGLTSSTPTGRPRALLPETHVLTAFTSATTGDHRPYEKTAAQLFGEAKVLVQCFGFDKSTVLGAMVPAQHIYGLLFTVLVPLLSGAAFLRKVLTHPSEVRSAAIEHSISDLITVAHQVAAFVNEGGPPPSGVRRVFSSGAVLDRRVAADFVGAMGCQVVDVLGSTESGGIGWKYGDQQAPYTPLPGVDVDTHEDDRLLLRSRFLPDHGAGWHRMADRIKVVSGGFLHLGRDDGIVKMGGKRVALQELEARARSLPGIEDAAALARDSDTLRGKEVWLVVASTDPGCTPESIRRGLAGHFDAVLLPRRYRVVERLPRGALGKVQARALLELFEQNDSSAAARNTELVLPQPTLTAAGAAEQLHSRLEVPTRWRYFEGHFPGHPILSGVAQLSEIVLPSVSLAWPDLGALREVVRLKYMRPVAPGAHLDLSATRESGSASVRFELREGEHVVTAGHLRFPSNAEAHG